MSLIAVHCSQYDPQFLNFAAYSWGLLFYYGRHAYVQPLVFVVGSLSLDYCRQKMPLIESLAVRACANGEKLEKSSATFVERAQWFHVVFDGLAWAWCA